MFLPILLQSALLAMGQVALKSAMQHIGPLVWSAATLRSILFSWRLALAGLCFSAAGVLWMLIVRRWPLSEAYPLSSVSYILGMVAAVVFLHETVDGIKWLGVLLIVAGCIIIAR